MPAMTTRLVDEAKADLAFILAVDFQQNLADNCHLVGMNDN